MNSENFHEYLKNPSKLHQVSYQELKSLVLQYPFSPNLRYLLMVKSMFDQNKDYDRNLTLAAMYTPDRKKLWKLVKQNGRLKEIKENYELNEEFLELKDLSSLEEMIENQSLDVEDLAGPKEMKLKGERPLPEDSLPKEKGDAEVLNFLSDDEDLDFLEELVSEPDEVKGGTPAPEVQNVEETGERKEDTFDISQAADEPVGELSSLEDLLETDQSVDEEDANRENQKLQPEGDDLEYIISEEEFLDEPTLTDAGDLADVQDETAQPEEVQPAPQAAVAAPAEPGNPAPAPLPKDAFRSWRKELQPAKSSLLSGGLKNLPAQKKFDDTGEPEDDFEDDYPEEEAKHIAAQSVKEDSEIASETLALVLEKQEHFEKAIAMYKRLLLQNPEKSSFFAAKIRNLKNKM